MRRNKVCAQHLAAPADNVCVAPPVGIKNGPATPRSESATLRLPLFFLTKDGASFDPRLNADANADLYQALPTAAGRGLARAQQDLPALDRWFVRVAEAGMLTFGLVPLSVYLHEAGHYERATRAGYDATITMTGLASGYTSYWSGAQARPDAKTALVFSLAGVNQEEFNSETIYRKASALDHGRLNWATGLAYVIARTNLPGYQIFSLRLSGNASSSDDMAKWGHWLEDTRQPLSLKGSAALSTAAALASPLMAMSIYGGIRYLLTGKPTFEIPSLRLGSVALQVPDLHVYLHPQGALVEGRTALRHDASGVSVEGYGFADVGGSVAGGGIAVNEIPLVEHVTASPRVGLSGGKTGFGFDLGLGVGYALNQTVGLSANVGVMNNHPLAEATGRRTGVSADLGLRLSF